MAGQGEACRGCATADVLHARIKKLESVMMQAVNHLEQGDSPRIVAAGIRRVVERP